MVIYYACINNNHCTISLIKYILWTFLPHHPLTKSSQELHANLEGYINFLTTRKGKMSVSGKRK